MTAAPTTDPRSEHALLAGLIDLADPDRPPHPGGRPCGALCVPACTATHGRGPHMEPPTAPLATATRRAQHGG